MHIDLPDNSVDLLYTNCVDHAFDLQQFFTEHARVIKPKGFVLYDIALSGTGGVETAGWNDDGVIIRMLLEHFREMVMVQREADWLWCIMRGKRSPQE